MCPKCKKSHLEKNQGPLTKCELDIYLKRGSKTSYPNHGYKYTFGSGNRFQFTD